MSTTISSLTSKASTMLNDAGQVRWTEAELLGWINLGLKEVVTFDPPAHTKTVAHALVAGAAQTLPSEALTLINITRNLAADGITPGRQIRRCDKSSLDAMFPNWEQEPKKSYTSNWMYDPRDPLSFDVSPPVLAGTKIEVTYSYHPADVTAGEPMPISEKYIGALLDYIMYKSLAKETEQPESAKRAAAHFSAFTSAIAAIVTNRNGGARP